MESSSQAVSPLRQRMIEDMRMRKLGEKTQLAYIRAVRKLAAWSCVEFTVIFQAIAKFSLPQ